MDDVKFEAASTLATMYEKQVSGYKSAILFHFSPLEEIFQCLCFPLSDIIKTLFSTFFRSERISIQYTCEYL